MQRDSFICVGMKLVAFHGVGAGSNLHPLARGLQCALQPSKPPCAAETARISCRRAETFAGFPLSLIGFCLGMLSSDHVKAFSVAPWRTGRYCVRVALSPDSVGGESLRGGARLLHAAFFLFHRLGYKVGCGSPFLTCHSPAPGSHEASHQGLPQTVACHLITMSWSLLS